MARSAAKNRRGSNWEKKDIYGKISILCSDVSVPLTWLGLVSLPVTE